MIADHPQGRPALLPALAAMTWLQALVALALFAPGAVAPTASLNICGIAVFEWLRPEYAGLTQVPQQLGMRAPLALASSDHGIAALAAYAGLLVTPVLISVVEDFASLTGASVGLAILAFGETAALVWGDAR